VRTFYREHGRDFPWRHTFEPYDVLVSEMMLQQTQAPRVAQKYAAFLARFPDFKTLAAARQSDVLKEWQGLGYNRRALRLKRIAEIVVAEHGGVLPDEPRALCELPGIGWNTAAAICVYAFNRPVVYIETNIRRIVIHDFFPRTKEVTDAQVMPLVARVLDHRNPREWYWALMDYGANLPRIVENPNRRSAHYAKHTVFAGSNRELRGKLLRVLIEQKRAPLAVLASELDVPKRRAGLVVRELEQEGFVKASGKVAGVYRIA
jgi:A/G-specific adenine glycosylase